MYRIFNTYIRLVASKVGDLSALVKDWKCVTVHQENMLEEDITSSVARNFL
jgi:hypothetical protein